MNVDPRQLRNVVSCLLFLAVLCSCQSEKKTPPNSRATGPDRSSIWSFADLPAPGDTLRPSRTLELLEVGRFGSADGPGWLSEISSVSANDSVLVVGQARACEFVVYSRRGGRNEKNRLGQCGDGPTDFKYIGPTMMRGETLLVIDRQSRRGKWLTQSGAVISSFTFDTTAIPPGNDIRSVSLVRDSILLVNVWQNGHSYRDGAIVPNTPDHPFLKAINRSSSGTAIGALVEGKGVSFFNHGEIREEVACAVPSGPHSSTLVVALNRWMPQLVVLNADSLVKRTPPVLVNRLIPGFPLDVVQSVLTPTSFVARHIEIACGDSLALVTLRMYTDSTSRLAQSAYLLAVDPFTGDFATLEISKQLEAALGSLKGAHGNTFFFGHNTRFGYPQIVEMRLQLKPLAGKD